MGGLLLPKCLLVPDKRTIPSKSVEKGKCEGYKTDQELAEEYYNESKEVSIKNIDNQRWAAYISHPTKGPTMGIPGITQIDGQFQVAPRDVSVVILNYYVQPCNAVFAYDITPGNLQTGAGDQIIYDKKNSKPLPWPNTIRTEFIIRLAEIYGIFTREQYISSFFKAKQTA